MYVFDDKLLCVNVLMICGELMICLNELVVCSNAVW